MPLQPPADNQAMRPLKALLITLSTLAAAACFDIEQTLTFEKDLSGTAGFVMKIDMEPIAGFMAMMKHSMTGKTGAPTEADIAEARKEMLSGMSRSKPRDMEKEKAEFASKLPTGVRLLDASFKDEGLKLAANLRLGFDQASKLNDIKLDSGTDATAVAPVDNPMESPFGGLKIVDEGRTVLITSPARNPLGDQQAQAGQMPALDPAMKSQLDALLRTLRVAFRITAPFEVVEHNAHRREGNSLVWEFNLASLEKMTPDQMTQGIRVRYRK